MHTLSLILHWIARQIESSSVLVILPNMFHLLNRLCSTIPKFPCTHECWLFVRALLSNFPVKAWLWVLTYVNYHTFFSICKIQLFVCHSLSIIFSIADRIISFNIVIIFAHFDECKIQQNIVKNSNKFSFFLCFYSMNRSY